MDIVTSALLPILTGLISLLVYRHSINKDKSSLILDLNKEIEKEKPSKMVVEYLFSIIYKARGTEYPDICLLISHSSPQRAIANFLSVQRHINAIALVHRSDGLGVIIHNEWAKGWHRRLRQTAYLISSISMYFLAIYFSNASYDYFLLINGNSAWSLIKNSGFANVAMDMFVNLSIPVLFSIAGYISLRGWTSSLIIDETARFLANNQIVEDNNTEGTIMLKYLKKNVATILAIIALLATFTQMWMQRDLNKTSLRPIITAYYSIDGSSETKKNGLYFYNGGLGNAIVHKTLVTIDGKPVEKTPYGDFYSAIKMLDLDAACFIYATPRENDFLIKDKETFFIEANKNATGACGLSQTILALKEQLLLNDRFNFKIQFSSAYGEKFTYNYRRNTQIEGWN